MNSRNPRQENRPLPRERTQLPNVRIEPLRAKNIDVEACCCLTYDEQFRKAAPRKKKWLRSMMKKGLRALILFEDDNPAGFIEYQPIELPPCPAVGKDLYFINCIMVHLWDFGPGKMKGKGYGRKLVEAAEQDVSENTKAKGIAAWGFDHRFWFMPYSFFKHLGYAVVDRQGERVLLLKKFRSVENPKFRPISFEPEPQPGTATIDFFYSLQCPFRLNQLERWRRIASEFGEEVQFNEHPTDDLSILEEYGISSGVFINGEEVFAGPMSDEEVRDKISAAIDQVERGFSWD